MSCQVGYHLSNNFFVFLIFSAPDEPSVTPWSGSWSRGWWQRRAGADHWSAYRDIGGDETSDSDLEAPTRHRQTIMAACYGDTQPSGTAMASLSRHQPSNRGPWLIVTTRQEKLSQLTDKRFSGFMASQLLIYVQICASLLRLRGSLDRRVTGAFSLSPAPVPWASGHNTDHIRSHFYPNHCIVSNIRVN